MDAVAEGADPSEARPGTPAVAPPDELDDLRVALDDAGGLPLDDRLELLRRAESTIARALEGLDGL